MSEIITIIESLFSLVSVQYSIIKLSVFIIARIMMTLYLLRSDVKFIHAAPMVTGVVEDYPRFPVPISRLVGFGGPS